MRGKRVKQIRRAVYGDLATKSSVRKYHLNGDTICADEVRQTYQKAKRDWLRLTKSERIEASNLIN
jgi:hypothetical protein